MKRFSDDRSGRQLWGWLLVPTLVLMLGLTHKGHCHQGPQSARLVGYWMVDNGSMQQLVRVRPDLSVDYGVGDLDGRLQLGSDGKLAWSTKDAWYGTERRLQLDVLRWCGKRGLTMLVVTDSSDALAVGQRLVWSRLDDSAGSYFSLSNRDESK